MKLVRKKKDGSVAEIKTTEKISQIELLPWKVLIVDDEIDIHEMTQLGLEDFRFANRTLQIFQAMSGTEAREILRTEPDITVALIDVVMETDDAGLLLVDYIRNELKYSLIRLIIRTGQPGMAPEREVIESYDIDDYKSKTELRDDKLYTTIRMSLKSYRDLVTLDSNRKALRKILETVPEFHHAQSLNQFFNGVLCQLIGLCNLGKNSLISTVDSGFIVTADNHYKTTVQSSIGRFVTASDEVEKIRQICLKKIAGEINNQALPAGSLLLPLEINQKSVGFVYLENAQHLSQDDLDLIQIMAHQCASALETLQILDIAEQARQEAEIARQEAEIANKAKSQFLANMSHELRTPLNAIIGYGAMLQEDAEELGQKDFVNDLQKIEAASEHLLGLINDVLDISKIEADKMDVYLETFDLVSIIKEVIITIQPMINTKHNFLEVIIDDSLGNMHTDLTKLRQMLLNLISNAAKFTQNGTIQLDVKPDGEWVNFCVTDNGVGITYEQQQNLFDPFSQADSSTTRRYGGTGLGLAITKQFAKMVGGTIWVESEFGHGSTFMLSLPVQAKTTKLANEIETSDSPSKDGIILVVDDARMMCELLKADLSKLGYAVAAAENGDQGIELAYKLRPDAIILDVNMPPKTKNGWEVLAVLKSDSLLAQIPIIMTSMDVDNRKCLALGATDCIDKTVIHSQLATMLEKYHIGDNGNKRLAMIMSDD